MGAEGEQVRLVPWPLTLLVLYAIGYVGYLIFRGFNLPAPGLIGAMVGTAVAAILGFPWGEIPELVNVALQALVGIMIGSRFDQESVKRLKTLFLPAMAVALWMMATGVIAGVLLQRMTGLDPATAIFGAAPGGIAEMSVIAFDYGAAVSTVALLQFIRIMGTYALIPLVTKYLAHHFDSPEESMAVASFSNESQSEVPLFLTLIIGFSAGLAAWRLGLPAGAIIGAMLAVGLLRSSILSLPALPGGGIRLAQIGLGGLLGLTFDADLLNEMGAMLWPVILLSTLLLLSALGLAFLLHYLFKWPLVTCLLSSATAGLSQMSVIALEMRADALKVSLLHLVRVVTIVICLPPIIALLLR